MKPMGVIFDMDGVLVDSYRAHYESWRQLAVETGCQFSEEEFAQTFGRRSRDILAGFWPVKLSAQQITAADDRKEHLYRQILQTDFPAMPGARDLLEALHAAGFALAVGSSGPKANLDVVMDALGAAELFGATVTRKDVTRGKPDPEVFLTCARRLGVSPQWCAVVEDAPAGVEAANRARMTSIAITGTVPREQLAAAKIVIDGLDELPPHRIAELIAN